MLTSESVHFIQGVVLLEIGIVQHKTRSYKKTYQNLYNVNYGKKTFHKGSN